VLTAQAMSDDLTRMARSATSTNASWSRLCLSLREDATAPSVMRPTRGKEATFCLAYTPGVCHPRHPIVTELSKPNLDHAARAVESTGTT
jgi:hypothetical protein